MVCEKSEGSAIKPPLRKALGHIYLTLNPGSFGYPGLWLPAALITVPSALVSGIPIAFVTVPIGLVLVSTAHINAPSLGPHQCSLIVLITVSIT